MITSELQDDIIQNTKDYIIANALYVAIGTGTTTPTSADTTLETEVVRNARQEYTENTSNVIISAYFTSGQANGSNITESGVLDAASSGTLLSRDTSTAISKTASIELWIDTQYDIEVEINYT